MPVSATFLLWLVSLHCVRRKVSIGPSLTQMAIILQTAALTIIHYIIFFKDILLMFILKYAKRFWSNVSVRWPNGPSQLKNYDCPNLQKLPLHIGIVIVEEYISYSDLANIIIWCMTMGIWHISLYDQSGRFTQNKEKLEKYLQQQRTALLGEENPKYSMQLHIEKKQGFSYNIENVRHGGDVNIYLLNPADGRQSIVEICRYLASEVKDCRYKLADIQPCSVDDLIQASKSFPDPDLVIRFGAVSSLLGYLPWQTRLSEILCFPTHQDIDYHSFCQLLVSFGNTRQRFGK